MTCKDCLYEKVCFLPKKYDIEDYSAVFCKGKQPSEWCEDFKDQSRFHFAKYDLGEMVWYGDKFYLKQGEIIEIYFDGIFNNVPKYEIEYNGNCWAEDDVFSTREEAEKALKERESE